MSEHNEGRPDWYERLRSDSEFPGSTFTGEKMNQIERRALSGEAARRGISMRVITPVLIVCVVAFAIGLVVGGPQADNWKPAEVLVLETKAPYPSESTEPVPTASSMPSASDVPEPSPSSTYVAQVYRLKAPVRAQPESQPYASRVSFEGNTTDTYYIEESAGDHVKLIDPYGNAGWVPRWYIVGESPTNDRVQEIAEPYPMIVDKPVTYRLYPDEPTPSGFELWAGKVVNVVRTYGDDWLEIEIITYDSPYLENKWLRKDELIPYEASKAREGYTSHLAILYDENGRELQSLPLITYVYINGEQGDRYWVTAGGGISGYIDKTDFIPDPFSFSINVKVVDQ